jgi:hypothetical protein
LKKQRLIEIAAALVHILADLLEEIELDTPEKVEVVLRQAGYEPDENVEPPLRFQFSHIERRATNELD